MKHAGLALSFAAAAATYLWLATSVLMTGSAPLAAVLAFAATTAVALLQSRQVPTPEPHLCNDCGSVDPEIIMAGFCTRCGSDRVWLPVTS